MNIEDLYEKLDIGESSEVEFKSAKGGLPKSLWSSLSAFANTAGGYIILGVEEKGGVFELGSLKNSNTMLKQFWDTHNNREKLNNPICKEEDVSVLTIENSLVIIIYVPISLRKERPVYLNGNPYKGTYKRSYEGDYGCSKEEVNQMLRDSSSNAQDSEIVEDFSMDDIDMETLNSYRNRFRTRFPDHPYLALDDKELLSKIGAYRRDRKTKVEGLTLAGLMIFGKETSITEAFPHFHLDYQERLQEERWSYRITQDGTWECNVYNFYYKVYNRIIQDIAVPFALESDGTRVGETHVHEAMREVLVNTLIHADHKTTKSIVVIKSKNSFKFINPGRLRVSIEQLYEGGVSDPRNPNIQKIFQFLGLGEKAGTGFSKILRAWSEQSWLQPLVSVDYDSELTYILLPLLSMIPEKIDASLCELIGEEY
ncbi:MAG: putative DNA binding domain-containing protein, partial [Sulfurovaceae bacterium]|nr:putative DNA binding domain-containing protein [Sulfurovaceae bacterium]